MSLYMTEEEKKQFKMHQRKTDTARKAAIIEYFNQFGVSVYGVNHRPYVGPSGKNKGYRKAIVKLAFGVKDRLTKLINERAAAGLYDFGDRPWRIDDYLGRFALDWSLSDYLSSRDLGIDDIDFVTA